MGYVMKQNLARKENYGPSLITKLWKCKKGLTKVTYGDNINT